jgi:hypothetical protein
MVRDDSQLKPSDTLSPQQSASGSCSNASIKMPPGAVRPILISLHGLLTLAKVDLDPTTDFIAGTIAGRKSAIINLITIRFNILSTPGIAGLLIAHPFDTGMLVVGFILAPWHYLTVYQSKSVYNILIYHRDTIQ